MTVHRRWVRRSLALWGGLAAAWGAGAAMTYLRFRDHLGPVLLATALVAVLFGGLWTARLRAQDDRQFLTVGDLRRP